MQTTTTTNLEESIDALNKCLRGELSAVETYRQALERIQGAIRADLELCMAAHERRGIALRRRIVEIGGTPSEGSGAWGAFAKLVEGGARLFGDQAAVAALEEGEDHGLALYRDVLEKLDPESFHLVQADLLPSQQETHGILSSIKHTLH